jgi:DNA topoisomerase IA
MIVCIAEKPSVARDLAEILGAKNRKDGYLEGNGYAVTWVYGHLCSLKDPEDYNPNWKYWKLEDLPIIPAQFGIKLRGDDGAKKQFHVIERLVSQATEVINCGDAGQEGELIQRWVLLKAKCKVPVKRLWISSLTEEAIKDGFKKLRPGSDFDRLFAAGNARAVGDWVLGINGTRLFTRKYGRDKQTLSVGRVQTPTLALIVQRQKEIDAFKSDTFFELKTIYRETEFSCQIERLKTKEKAQKGLDYLSEQPFEVTSFEQKDAKEGNPRLYDLTSLQVDGNRYYAYSAEETLNKVQSLYEKKLVTYPRVDPTFRKTSIPKFRASSLGSATTNALQKPWQVNPSKNRSKSSTTKKSRITTLLFRQVWRRRVLAPMNNAFTTSLCGASLPCFTPNARSPIPPFWAKLLLWNSKQPASKSWTKAGACFTTTSKRSKPTPRIKFYRSLPKEKLAPTRRISTKAKPAHPNTTQKLPCCAPWKPLASSLKTKKCAKS